MILCALLLTACAPREAAMQPADIAAAATQETESQIRALEQRQVERFVYQLQRESRRVEHE